MDDAQNMDILTTYQLYLVKQMDVIFSAVVLGALANTNDLRMRANAKELEKNYKYNYQQFLVNLEKIVNPENAGDPEGAAAAAREELGKENGAVQEGEVVDDKPKKPAKKSKK